MSLSTLSLVALSFLFDFKRFLMSLIIMSSISFLSIISSRRISLISFIFDLNELCFAGFLRFFLVFSLFHLKKLFLVG